MKQFSPAWNASKKPRKQRKYRAKLLLHLRKKLIGVHLTKELRKKYHTRSVTAHTGDKVKILRGQFRGKEGIIHDINRKYEAVYIEGVEVVKKDGTKSLFPVHPSNLVATELNLEDKRRREKLEVRGDNITRVMSLQLREIGDKVSSTSSQSSEVKAAQPPVPPHKSSEVKQ